MLKSQAKKLKAGDRVIWTNGAHVGGVVVKKKWNTVWILWDDGLEKTHYADTMDHVFTAEQLAQLEEEKRVAEKVKDVQSEWRKTRPYKW
jgi:hypothetical protein